MERGLLITGIGGQGVQLAGTVLARSAIAEGRQVQLFGSYGGMMRGGNTEVNLVVADAPITSPPTVATAWAAIVMHHDYSAPTFAKCRPGSIVFVNSSVFEGGLDRDAWTVVDVPAMDMAVDLGNALLGSMVMTGAFARVTGLVDLESLRLAVTGALPSYRERLVAANIAALELGWQHVDAPLADAWSATTDQAGASTR